MKIKNKIRTALCKFLFPDIYNCIAKINLIKADMQQFYDYDLTINRHDAQLRDFKEFKDDMEISMRLYRKRHHALILSVEEIAKKLEMEQEIKQMLYK